MHHLVWRYCDCNLHLRRSVHSARQWCSRHFGKIPRKRHLQLRHRHFFHSICPNKFWKTKDNSPYAISISMEPNVYFINLLRSLPENFPDWYGFPSIVLLSNSRSLTRIAISLSRSPNIERSLLQNSNPRQFTYTVKQSYMLAEPMTL